MNQRKRLQREWSFVYMIDISTPTNLPVIPLARVTYMYDHMYACLYVYHLTGPGEYIANC